MDFTIVFKDYYFEVKLAGIPSVRDCGLYFDELVSHEQWRPGSLVLSDETELDLSSLSSNMVTVMANIGKSKRNVLGSARFAAYVNSDLVFGMNRMFQARVEFDWDAEIGVFKSRQEAVEWLFGKVNS